MYADKQMGSSESLLKAVKEAMMKKKLDPVGKEDQDVNNDGKTNSSDSYLKNRRAAISSNMKKEEVEQQDEGMMDTVKSAAKKALEKVGGGSDEDQLKNLQKKMNVPQTGKKPEMKEERDTPGNGYEHQCALHVKHAKLGEGKTLFSQHAQPDDEGNIAWYDVMFDEGIVRVETKDVEILVSESHMNHKKKKM